MRALRLMPLAVRMVVLVAFTAVGAAAATAGLAAWMPPWPAALLAAAGCGLLAGLVVRRTFVPLRGLIRALTGTVASYRDGDFSFGISWDR